MSSSTFSAMLFVSVGCDLSGLDSSQKNALCLASEKGNDVIMSQLLETLPRPLIFPVRSAIPIHAAARHGHDHIVEKLVEAGCDVDQVCHTVFSRLGGGGCVLRSKC